MHSQPVLPTGDLTIQMKEPQKPTDEDEGAMNVWDCGSPLYDSYELVSLSHVIDRHTMVLPSLSGSRSAASQFPVAANAIPSRSSSSMEAASRKLRGSAVLAFLSKFMERYVWKRRISSCRTRGEIRSPGRISIVD